MTEPAEFLEDNDGTHNEEDYVKPDVELKLSKEKRTVCREIVQEINRFGVNQRQKLYLVYLLGLELENREAMLAVTDAVRSIRDKVDVSLIQMP